MFRRRRWRFVVMVSELKWSRIFHISFVLMTTSWVQESLSTISMYVNIGFICRHLFLHHHKELNNQNNQKANNQKVIMTNLVWANRFPSLKGGMSEWSQEPKTARNFEKNRKTKRKFGQNRKTAHTFGCGGFWLNKIYRTNPEWCDNGVDKFKFSKKDEKWGKTEFYFRLSLK